jgi:hypothetical protein
MKILAIEKESANVNWANANEILEEEALRVYQLYLADNIREIYFTKNNNAVLILEVKDILSAKELLNTLPLVKQDMIEFDIMELKPYTGYGRLIK